MSKITDWSAEQKTWKQRADTNCSVNNDCWQKYEKFDLLCLLLGQAGRENDLLYCDDNKNLSADMTKRRKRNCLRREPFPRSLSH